jgi:hypothetical protein
MNLSCLGRGLRRALLAVPVLALLLAVTAPAALADPPPSPFFNGFETNLDSWFPNDGSTITRVMSGYTNAGGYASGIASASDNWHARLGLGATETCVFGGGVATINPGPFTRWGGYSSVFPPNGYTTRVDIYLDVGWAQSHLDKRFDWSSAISNTSGGFRRDFVFNVGTDALGFVITGGNNATRCGANPYSTDPNHAPQVHIMQSGWYTFQHAFKNVGGFLVVEMTVIRKSDSVVMGTWTRNDPSDIIGVNVGGNRYGWFVNNEFPDLAIDNSERTGLTLALTPKSATNPAGTQHCVAATVGDTQGPPGPSGVIVRFSVTGANSTSGSATTAAGVATFCYTGTYAGTDTISAYADVNNNNVQDAGEPSDTATKTWTAGAPATLTLAPAADTNEVGETHCVTATVEDAFGNPVSGVRVYFSVPTSPATHASPSSDSAVTNSSGQAQFCFTASLPGEDTIDAFADSNGNGMLDAGEPVGAATKTWTLPVSTSLCEVTITNGGWIVANNGDRSNFGGNARVDGSGNPTGQEEYQDQGSAQPMNVHSTRITATTCTPDRQHATIYGEATIDGSGTWVFRIDVTDMGSPSTNDAYGIMLSDGYDSGIQPLGGGNITIH